MHEQRVGCPGQLIRSRHVHVIGGQNNIKVGVADKGPVGEVAAFKAAVARVQIKLPVLGRAVAKIDYRHIGAVVPDQKVAGRRIETDRDSRCGAAGLQRAGGR